MKSVTRTRSSSRKRRKKFRPWLLLFRIVAWTILAGVVWCGYLLWLINSYDYSKSIGQADAGIVLGAALWNDVPSPALKERLNLAYELYETGKVEHLILSGGLDGNGSKLTEAEGMRKYLIEKGMPVDKLYLENAARSTYENLLYSKLIADKQGWKRITVITHDYHSARSLEIARYLNYTDVESAALQSKVLKPINNETREVLAFTKWKLDRLLLQFGYRSPDSSL
ncbi:MAG: YdcF family protein [Candidatus Pristimantibacillus sp.]